MSRSNTVKCDVFDENAQNKIDDNINFFTPAPILPAVA